MCSSGPARKCFAGLSGLLATVPANVNLRTYYSYDQAKGICEGNGMKMRNNNAKWGSLCPVFFAKTLSKKYGVIAWDRQDPLRDRFPKRGVVCVLHERPACE